MVILPYTRPKWHIQGVGLFALGSFWMASWGWYSATGLIFADIAINATLKTELKRGLRIHGDWRVPYWVVALLSGAVGVALKYTWAVLPQYDHSMLVLHPYLDLSENYSPKTFITSGPYARLDDWLIICAVMTAVELFQNAQYFLSFKPLVWLGERSFSESTLCVSFMTFTANSRLRHILCAVHRLLDRRNQAVACIGWQWHQHCRGQCRCLHRWAACGSGLCGSLLSLRGPSVQVVGEAHVPVASRLGCWRCRHVFERLNPDLVA